MIGNLLGGLAQGYAQGKMQQMKFDREGEMLKLQKDLLGLKKAQEQTKQRQLQLSDNLINYLTQGQQQGQEQETKTPTEEEPQFSERFPGISALGGAPEGEPNLVEMLAQGPSAVAQGPDVQAQGPTAQGGRPIDTLYRKPGLILQGEQLGLPLSRIAEIQRHVERGVIETVPDASGGMHYVKIDPYSNKIVGYIGPAKLPPYEKITQTTPGAGTTEQFVLPYQMMRGGGGVQTPTPMMQTKPDIGNLPISEQNIPLWIHPETLQSPQFGVTPNQAEKQGFKRISTNDRTKINDLRGVRSVIARIRELTEKVFPKTETPLGRIAGGAKRTLGALAQVDLNARTLRDMLEATLAPLIRALGEKGTLATEDVTRARGFVFDLDDRADLVWDKLQNMENLFSEIQKSTIAGTYKPQKEAGKGKPALSMKKELPPQAVKQLKEGQYTTFKNGQIWTIYEGIPTYVGMAK